MRLPGDGHVHSEWSWDTGGPDSDAIGTMEATCRRAERIGLPALAFTEHLDPTTWVIDPDEFDRGDLRVQVRDRRFSPRPFDADGYLAAIDRARRDHPGVRILSGVEFGQPHLDDGSAGGLVDLAALDRVNGSLHTLPRSDEPGAERSEPPTLYREWPAERVVEVYLAELMRMAASPVRFDVVTHLDYAVRYWPTVEAGPFDPWRFEDGFRQAMRAVAASGRALEFNVGGQIRPWIPRWWREEGGRAMTIASDAHTPDGLARSFPEASGVLEWAGFRPGRDPEDPWVV